MSRLIRLIPVIGLALFAVVLYTSQAQTAPNTTVICTSITSDTTWTVASSPYEICDTGGLKIQQGATLTIQPGVTVMFDGADYQFAVEGTLNSLGTASQPITITGKTKTAGSWRGLLVAGTGGVKAALNMDYTTVQYGGGFTTAEIYADLAAISINHSRIQSSIKNGLELTNNASFTVQNTSFTDNIQDAMTVHEPKTDLTMTGLTASGVGQNVVHIVGLNTQMHGQRYWANPGIPYIIEGLVNNGSGDVLTINPGSDLRFNGGSLYIAGQLSAQGTAAQPITMTATTKAPGSWRGLYVYGGTQKAVAQLDYATVEYGGGDIGGANIDVTNGSLIAHHTTVRYSAKDGVRFDNSSGGSILQSQIISNTGYSVYNPQLTTAVLATNDWWGDPNGPHSDVTTCSTGNGGKVTAGVLFKPVLANPNTIPPFPLSDAPILTLTPRRWYAPADNQTRVYFDITLHDGNGIPMLGRTVKLHSSLGTVVDGSVTDTAGKALAYLTSANAGDANVTASLDATTSCEATLTPQAKVTFMPPLNLTELFPNSPAPYLSNDISVTPLPVIVGVTTTVKATLINPLNVPITVDVAFQYAQAGIGLAYGPISNQNGLVVPANGSLPLQASLLPPISGHYCAQVSYTITQVGKTALKAPLDGGSGLKQFNWDAKPGPPLPPDSKDSLDKADKSWNKVKKLPGGAGPIQQGMLDSWWGWVKDTASKASQALGFDPPRQDYTTPTMPVLHTFAHVQPDANISAQRADALNSVSDALLNVEAYGTAATTALDRYGGASAAGNLTWASVQSNEMLYYEHQLGSAMVTYADKLDALVSVLQTEGVTQTIITVDDVIAYQTRLATSGFTDQEKADAHQAGKTEDDIEAMRQEIIATHPVDIAGDLISIYTGEAATARQTGNAILNPAVFNPGYSVGGSAGLSPTATTGNVMAQVYNTTETIQLRNPLTQTQAIAVQARRIDLPADWSVQVSPSQPSLLPGQQITVTVTILAGSPVPQGSVPRVAIEGFAGSKLLGGVVIDVVVPQYMPFDGKLHVYMPVIRH